MFELWPADDSRGWNCIRMVTWSQGVDKVTQGKWKLHELNGEPWYFQIRANFEAEGELPSGASSTSITVRECQLNAGIIETRRGVILAAKSRTASMTEEQRISRKNKFGEPLPPEDAIERAQAKVKECAEHRIWDPIKIVDVEFTLPVRPWDAFPDLAREA
jgi:hypothetical protein